jgi:chromo domain-containing protein 1
MGTRKFRKYCQNNEERFNRAREEFKRLQDIRQKKRAKKRKNLSKRNQRVIGGDNSEEGIPPRQQRRVSEVKAKSSEAIPTHSQELYNSLFVDSQDPSPLRPPPALDQRGRGPTARRPLVARPPPIEQSTDDEDEALSADDSAESLLGELAAKAKNKTRKVTSRSRGNKEPNIGNSVLLSGSPCQKATRPLVKPATDQATTEAHIQAQRKSPKPTRTLTASVHSTTPSTEQKEQGRRPNDSAAQVAPTKASNNLGSKPSSTIVGSAAISKPTKPATSASAQETTIPVASPTSRRTGTASKAGNPIRITNAKKEPPRRKEWDTENVLYGKLKFRGLADKRSHAEGTPDLNALEFVGAGAPIMARPRPSNPADNLYSRRETGSRRIQEFDRDTSPRRDSIEEGGPLRDWEMNKVPMVCPHWRLSSNCPYTPERCRFMHRHKDAQGCDLPVGPIDGKIPGKYRKPPLTCLFYQKTAEGCRKTADQCDYAHYNTGFIPFSKTDTTPVHIDPNEVPLSEQSLSRILETNKAENQNAANHPVLSYQQKRRLKPAQLTCWYWKNGNECRNTPETCSFQHHDTGIVASAPAGARVPWRNTPQSRPSFERKSMDDMDMQDNDASLPTTSAAPPVESKQTQLPVVLSPPSTVDDGLRTLSLPVALPRTASTCLQLQDKMELAFKINYVDMFQWSDDGTERKMIDRTAFLMYHPLDHLEELELITRWLLMHHVEVSNVWFEGAWEWWAKKIEGTSSGIVIVSKRVL